jgi:hypothetical protein
MNIKNSDKAEILPGGINIPQTQENNIKHSRSSNLRPSIINNTNSITSRVGTTVDNYAFNN